MDAPPKTDRKRRLDVIVPGVSIGQERVTAGTLGCLVREDATGETRMLSNWHVFQGASGVLGDRIVQPGRFDDNRVARERVRAARAQLPRAGRGLRDREPRGPGCRGDDPRARRAGAAARRPGARRPRREVRPHHRRHVRRRHASAHDHAAQLRPGHHRADRRVRDRPGRGATRRRRRDLHGRRLRLGLDGAGRPRRADRHDARAALRRRGRRCRRRARARLLRDRRSSASSRSRRSPRPPPPRASS